MRSADASVTLPELYVIPPATLSRSIVPEVTTFGMDARLTFAMISLAVSRSVVDENALFRCSMKHVLPT